MKITIIVLALMLLMAAGAVSAAGKQTTGRSYVVVQSSLSPSGSLLSGSGSSATYEIFWQVISSGATRGNSASYNVDGTAGQTVVGWGSSDSYGMSQGFWQEFGEPDCCNGDGLRGNVDDITGPAGEVDVADLTYLVGYLFQGGSAPPCEDEGNTDGIVGPGGPIDVADLTYLVSYLFQGGPAPAACP